MKLNVKAFALTWAILWGAAVFLVALINLICGCYGQHFLNLLSSWYPGYHATRSIFELLIVTVYAFFDGLIGGAIFAWLYNCLIKPAKA
jgi:hypothetical protein